jgi:hypothetical protein
MYREWKKIEFLPLPPPKKIFKYEFGKQKRLRVRPRNRRQNEVRKDRRLVGGKWVEGKSTEQK